MTDSLSSHHTTHAPMPTVPRMRTTMSLASFSALLLTATLVAGAATPLPAQPTVPTPASILGWEPGTDRKLPTWQQVTDYFAAVDKASPYVSVRTLGPTTLGRPFIVAFISDPATLRRPAALPAHPAPAHGPARARTGAVRDSLIAQGKNVILITSSIHSTEVGGFLTPLVLTDRLARADTPEAREMLANTIIMLVPSQNPDGVDIVGDWYRSTIGTPAEGTNAAGALSLLHGARQQPRLVRLHAEGDALHDRLALHAVGSADRQRRAPAGRQRGAHLHSAVHGPGRAQHRPGAHGEHQRARHGDGVAHDRRGEDGRGHQRVVRPVVAGAAVFAQPSRRAHPHRDRERATRVAGARSRSSCWARARGYDAKVTTWNFPALWPGGTWGIGNIVDYQVSASVGAAGGGGAQPAGVAGELRGARRARAGRGACVDDAPRCPMRS